MQYLAHHAVIQPDALHSCYGLSPNSVNIAYDREFIDSYTMLRATGTTAAYCMPFVS